MNLYEVAFTSLEDEIELLDFGICAFRPSKIRFEIYSLRRSFMAEF